MTNSPNWRSIALTARALALGALAGIALLTCYQFVRAEAAERSAEAVGGNLLVPPMAQVEFAAGFSILAAFPIVLVCLPIWLIVTKYRLSGWFAVAALGFSATLAYSLVTNLDTPGFSVGDLVSRGIPCAICGAIAGFVAWWARPH